MVLFRDKRGDARALLDRCAHRNVALSEGKIVDHHLVCAYHGWRYDSHGACAHIPGLGPDEKAPVFQIFSFTTKEEHGLIWVTFTTEEPAEKPRLDYPTNYQTIHYRFDVEGTLDQALENQLDVMHTSILHAGWFRSEAARKLTTAKVIEKKDLMQVEYVGEKRPSGWIAKLIAPSATEVVHVDRLFYPGITQVEYRAGKTHFIATTFLTPTTEGKIKCHAIVHLHLPLPLFLTKLLLLLGVKLILRQDIDMLKKQSANIKRFPSLHFASTKLDVYAPFIRKQIMASANDGSESDEKKYDLPVWM